MQNSLLKRKMVGALSPDHVGAVCPDLQGAISSGQMGALYAEFPIYYAVIKTNTEQKNLKLILIK